MTIFFFSDIEGSTELWQKYPQAMVDVLARHDAILTNFIAKHGGEIVKHTGDGVFAVFETGEPLACALQAQKEFQNKNWEPVNELRVRISLHIGQANKRGEDYFGLDINRTARLLGAAWGGQILLTCELSRNSTPPPGSAFVDLGAHMLKDLSEPQHIFQLYHPDLPLKNFPALRTLSAHPHNLPPQPTPFIGRIDELREIHTELNRPERRLLTILGPGGIGKTRLAMQAAAEQVEAFQNGVYFVSLAPLNTGELLVPAIAETLRFTFYQQDNPKQQLINYLREKSILLILDNFEHITEYAEVVSEILASAPKVKILITSRERLNLREEHFYELSGLQIPEYDENIENSSSAKLFLQSAERIRPGFELAPEEQFCVARICRLVHGIPLGIELAAGWLRAISCQEIANEIELSLDFLEINLRNVPERHRSLRAVFDYSWKLLNEAEKQTLSTFSVFQGTFSREAAETVASPEKRQAFLTSVTGLADKSLVKHNSNGMYELHPLMRQYALEKLEENPAVAQKARTKHATYYLDFLARHDDALQGKNQPEALDAIAEDLENIRSALFWAIDTELWQYIHAAIPSLHMFYITRGREDECRTLFQKALSAAPKSAPANLMMRLQVFYAATLVHVSQLDEAQKLLSQHFDITKHEAATFESAIAASSMGTIAWVAGDYQKAIEFNQIYLNYQSDINHQAGISQALDKMGVVAWAMGDLSSAKDYFLKSLALAKEYGAPAAIARGLDLVGVAYRDTGEIEKARECFQEAMDISEKLGSKLNLAFAINHLAGIMGTNGQLQEAIRLFRKNIELTREIGDPRALAYNLSDMGLLLIEADEKDQGILLLTESLAIFQRIGDAFGEIVVQNILSRAICQKGKTGLAWEYVAQSLEKSIEIQNYRLITDSMIAYAWVAIETKNQEEAVEVFSFILHSNQDHKMLNEVKINLAEMKKAIPSKAFAQAKRTGAALTPHEILMRSKQKSKTG